MRVQDAMTIVRCIASLVVLPVASYGQTASRPDDAVLRAQIEAIRKLNRKADGFQLFAGVECDILRDGKLDFGDEILSELDFVEIGRAHV